MTKEELIELSDLNREDNVKYISSEAQGIAIALDSDIYAPTLCKLERAYICGRRKSENRISELEKENAELKQINGRTLGQLNLANGELIIENEKLKKENAELEEKISILLSCKNCPENKGGLLCQKEYEDKCLAQKIQYIKELKEEIKNNEDLATVAYMQGAEQQKKKYEKQLIKGKELLNEFMRISKASDEDFEHDYSELIGEAEQFLKEVSE